MKRKHLLTMGILVAIIIAGCGNSVPECDPVVIVSNTNYTDDPLSVPYSNIHTEFAETYSGADLSIELRDQLIERMEEKADLLGEDPSILYQCIRITYDDWSERPNRVPCYADKCIFQNQTAWAIAFNRANSFEETSLEHFDLFFVSYATYDVLYHTGCY
ncbi:MAG: hypothetical protein JSU64_01935 [candidate division WOR-3 bacterium]|nr:MAG: hypothetical protein JSU64_01935 [candidate division WOR-3 bacterium]